MSPSRTLLLVAAASGFTTPLSAKEPLPLEKRTFADAARMELPYRLLKPEGYDPARHYPLVVFLHGAGERGADNEKQLVHGVGTFAAKANRADYPCFLIAPQCPENRRWVEVDWSADSHQQPNLPSEPARLTLELITALQKEFSIGARRIYVTGLSMGGFGTWDLLARRPELFAAGTPVCGGADESTAPGIKDIPIWAFHGAKDGVVKPERSRKMVNALKKAGGKPRYTEYPEVGHDSWNRAYADREWIAWLFAQKKD